MGEYIITKIGLVTNGEKKGMYKISFEDDFVYVDDIANLKVGDPVPQEFLNQTINPLVENSLKNDIDLIIHDLEAANQNNAFIVLKAAINKLKQLIKE